ncbi:hypothetical protein BDK89_4034 [Ilumatobacter fluminis]|uniref:Lysylphosphatidylglycerol synthase-like protein n=1 Tax=Ilumatobacter fluminis TaxID=467091 RepID=A0A4R7I596_9ACTN|nr:YbhN family protein [Ilumatobacter fluminis]TDT18414.1 hypothetical protein BDK89_4034 [Ilumatobacter fluminis]
MTTLDTTTDDREVAALDEPAEPASGRRRWLRLALRVVVWPAVIAAIVVPQLPRFREASVELQSISWERLVFGFVLVLASIACYSGLTRTGLGAGDDVRHGTVFRIQLSTRALANVVPGGNATASALGFRLLTRAGASNTGAGVALATAGIGSAIVLNVVFWAALIIVIPTRGADRHLITIAALGGIVLALLLLAIAVVGLGGERVAGPIRRLAAKVGLDLTAPMRVVDNARGRIGDLIADRRRLARIGGWSIGQWTFDMAALWVFLSAFDISLHPLVLILLFGAANIAAAVPITPGGIGVVEGVYIASLVQLGFTLEAATFGIAAYRFAQYVFPIGAGALSYATLKVGPWRLDP